MELTEYEKKLAKITGANNIGSLEKLVDFLRYDFSSVLYVKQEDYDKPLLDFLAYKEGSYCLKDYETKHILMFVKVYVVKDTTDNTKIIGTGVIALNNQGWLLTNRDENNAYNTAFEVEDYLNTNGNACGINLSSVLVNNDGLAGLIATAENLVGKYVHIMQAPESTTLTDEQIAQIEEGVFINGTFLGLKNPVLFPSWASPAYYGGIIIGVNNNDYTSVYRLYSINKTTKEIFLQGTSALIFTSAGQTLANIGTLNGKTLPSNPANTGTFAYEMVDGTLTWKNTLNWKATITRSDNIPEGITFNVYHQAIEVINNVLYIVFNCSLENTTGSAISMPNNWTVLYSGEVPNEIAEKIIRLDGTNLTENMSTEGFIAPVYTKQGQYDYVPNDLGCYIGSSVAKYFSVNISSFSVPANTKIKVSGRTFLTLL